MTGTRQASPRTKGGAFLLETRTPEEIFTPEDLTPEHRAIAKTTEEFWNREIVPHLDEIRHQNHAAAAKLLKKSAELGLTAVLIPERFGGMEMDLTSMMVVASGVSADGSYSAWHGAQTGIGTLPLLLFGTEEQKARYLPKLASAEMIAAYCLSEPQAGSDALAVRTRADLSPDGSHYILNGQKMWITNGGFADLYTVFAKVDGDKFTAFLVERAWPGVSTGAEEKKMGIKGSSTTAVFFDNVRVPRENVLGEIGKGHLIAFNILNLGRLKLGAFTHGGCLDALERSIRYAKERHAFGQPIAQFGMIRHKLAEMAIRTFVSESVLYRVIGNIEAQLHPFTWESPDAAVRMLRAIEEFAIESSYVKILGSETLAYVVDEGVQIHGGYGFHQDYAIEHAYRDARVDRIFEGTNEINRLLATSMLLKRTKRGDLPLAGAVKALELEIASGTITVDLSDLIGNAKRAGLIALSAAFQKHGARIEEQQEVTAAITDMLMNAYAIETALLRAQKVAQHGSNRNAENASDMSRVFASEAMRAMETSGRTVFAACLEGETLGPRIELLRQFTDTEPVDTIALRQRIAARLIEAGRYVV